ncbi:MAG: LysE family transporter [Roseinatronobacter sp.]
MHVCAAVHLGWIAWASARSALRPPRRTAAWQTRTISAAYLQGLLLHVTNPKAILFVTALHAIGLPAEADIQQIVLTGLVLGLQSLLIFAGFAMVLSPRAS